MHHVDLALKYADRIIGIKAGEVVFDGPSKKINEKILVKIYGRGLKKDEVLGETDE
jgi:phosphonate transport system ATP-binding protein